MHFYCKNEQEIDYNFRNCADGSALLDVDNKGYYAKKNNIENIYVIDKPIINKNYKGFVKYYNGFKKYQEFTLIIT